MNCFIADFFTRIFQIFKIKFYNPLIKIPENKGIHDIPEFESFRDYTVFRVKFNGVSTEFDERKEKQFLHPKLHVPQNQSIKEKKRLIIENYISFAQVL